MSIDKLQMDPLMFEMPLDTCIEICDTKDVGYALSNAIENPDIWGEIMHLAGGERCRISYRDYLYKMLNLFGVGYNFLPTEAFSTKGFHCGFMSTNKSQAFLNYQRHTLDEYFEAVKKKVTVSRFFTTIFRPFARKYLLSKSHYYKEYLHNKNPETINLNQEVNN